MIIIFIDPFLSLTPSDSISRMAGQKNIVIRSRVRSVHKITIKWQTYNLSVKKWIKVRNVTTLRSTQGYYYILERNISFDILRRVPQSFYLRCKATLTYSTQSLNFWGSQNLYYNGTFFTGTRFSQRHTFRKITITVNRKQEFLLLL